MTIFDKILAWGNARGITGPSAKATLLTQLKKTQEELNETTGAALLVELAEGCGEDAEEHERELADGIGSTVVTLVLAANLAGLDFLACVQQAYDEIVNRTGKMIDGQFVKDK